MEEQPTPSVGPVTVELPGRVRKWISPEAQTIERGLSLTFGATTGHRRGDRWTFVAAPANIIVNRFVGGSALVNARITRDG